MEKILLVASSNRGKLREISDMLADTGWEIRSLADFPDAPALPPEDAPDFFGNALIKAKAAMEATGLIALGDDSGLVVDYLNGEPGVRSARYAEPDHNDEKNNQKLLFNMKDCPAERRTARFVSAMALVLPDGRIYRSEGICEGSIGYTLKGSEGFGYDPLFIVTDMNKTMAELSLAEKNQISHRRKALDQILKILLEIA
jgi:XTP/dITP diphosphohydrolase